MSIFKSEEYVVNVLGSKREVEDRIYPRSADADDPDEDVKSDEDRYLLFYTILAILVIKRRDPLLVY